MLETVRELIADVEADSIDFLQFYTEYVMSIQDENIEEELKFLVSNNKLTPMNLSKLLNSSLERMVEGPNGR